MYIQIKAYNNNRKLIEKCEIIDVDQTELFETVRYYLNSPDFAEVKIIRSSNY